MKTYQQIVDDDSNYVKIAVTADFEEGSSDQDGNPRTYKHIEMGKKRGLLLLDVRHGDISKEDFIKLQKKMRGKTGFLKYLFSATDYHKLTSI